MNSAMPPLYFYADRWQIEVAFEEGKHIFGVGHARNRTRNAVERTVPFSFSR